MNTQVNKVLDDKGRVHIPQSIRESVGMKENDLVRMSAFDGIVMLERIDIPFVDLVEKARAKFSNVVVKKEMDSDAIECFVMAALAQMGREKLSGIMSAICEMLEKR